MTIAHVGGPRAQVLLIAVLLTIALAACTSTTDPAAAPSTGPASENSPTQTQTPSDLITTGAFSGPVPFPLESTIPQLQKAMRTGRITSVELVEYYLARIAAYLSKKLLSFDFAQNFNIQFRASLYITGLNQTSE